MKSLNKFTASPRKANFGSCRKLLVHYYLSATKKGKPLSLTFTGPKKTRIRKLKHGGNTRLRCGELKRAECLLWTVLRHICFLFVCLFVYIYFFTPNLEKVCECNRRWLRKGPRSLVIGWDFLDQNHDVWQLDQYATRQFLVLVAIEQTPARSHYGQKIEKILIPTPQRTS